MCRLFGLTASPHRSHASFWLLDASDSLLAQSRRNPDGAGVGFFDPAGAPVLHKEPLAAFEDVAFAREARHVSSTTFVSHIRFATNGGNAVENTHPFTMDGRVFAHNGVVGDVERLEDELGDDLRRVQGQTDSERFFALITREIEASAGDVAAGVASAVAWIAEQLPVYSINFLLSTEHDLWAFRYPNTHWLFVLERDAGGRHGGRELHHASKELRVHSPHLVERPSVVVASEPMDDSPDWRLLESGELLHVGPDLVVESMIVIDRPPAHVLQIHHLTGQAST